MNKTLTHIGGKFSKKDSKKTQLVLCVDFTQVQCNPVYTLNCIYCTTLLSFSKIYTLNTDTY